MYIFCKYIKTSESIYTIAWNFNLFFITIKDNSYSSVNKK